MSAEPGGVPGLVVGEPIAGRDSTWHARTPAGATREVVVVRLSPDPDVRRAALAALAPLRLPGPGHRQHVLDLTPCRDGVAVVTVAVGTRTAGSLRGLSLGQVATLGLPLAREMAELHSRGVVFGASDLGRETGFDDSGRPVLLLGGWTVRRLSGTCEARPADDLAALVALLRRAAAPAEGRQAQRFARIGEAGDCTALVAALRRLARPRPLGEVRRPGLTLPRWGTSPRLRAVAGPLALVSAVALVAFIGWHSAAAGHHGSAPTTLLAAPNTVPNGTGSAPPAIMQTRSAKPPASSAPVDWKAVVASLDLARIAAFGGVGSLDQVDVRGGPAWAGDQQRWEALQQNGLRPRGLQPELTAVRVVQAGEQESQLLVTDRLPPYDLVANDGTVHAHQPGRGSETWQMTVRRTDAGWRVLSVTST